MKLTYDQLRTEVVARLNERNGQDGRAAERDAKILLSAVSPLSDASLMFARQEVVPSDLVTKALDLCSRCVAGEPIYRAIGKREFHGIEFALSEHTLEPRDDTEALIELVLDSVADQFAPLQFADLGTGPGTVALALLSELPNANCVATDLELGALESASQNAHDNGFETRVEFEKGNWFEALSGCSKNSFDFVVSNPPYIASDIVDGLDDTVRNHDPRLALDGGADGLVAYREILLGAGECLRPKGFLALEIGYDQAQQVSRLGEQCGWLVQKIHKDLGGNDRAISLMLQD